MPRLLHSLHQFWRSGFDYGPGLLVGFGVTEIGFLRGYIDDNIAFIACGKFSTSRSALWLCRFPIARSIACPIATRALWVKSLRSSFSSCSVSRMELTQLMRAGPARFGSSTPIQGNDNLPLGSRMGRPPFSCCFTLRFSRADRQLLRPARQLLVYAASCNPYNNIWKQQDESNAVSAPRVPG